MKKLALFSALALLALTGTAQAAEEQISTDSGTDLSAAGAYLLWARDEPPTFPWVLWHAGKTSTSQRDGRLGTDARGRVVRLFSTCRRNRCVLEEQRVDGGRTRPLVRVDGRLWGYDEDRGTLAFGTARGTFVDPAGTRPRRRVAAGQPNSLSTSRSFLAATWYGEGRGKARIRAVDFRKRKLRSVLLATSEDPDDDCKCTDPRIGQVAPQVDGSYVYWRETRIDHPDAEHRVSTRFLRVAMDDPAGLVQSYTPSHSDSPSPFAVEHGALIYSAAPYAGGGVFRVVAPPFVTSGERVPVGG